MYLHTVSYTRKGVRGCYCSLMECHRDKSGKPVHKRIATIGFVPEERMPFMKAAFSVEDPEGVYLREKAAIAEGETETEKHTNE